VSPVTVWNNADPPQERKSPDGGEAIRAKRQAGKRAQLRSDHTLVSLCAASATQGGGQHATFYKR
jgi:hypothetical protein